MTRKVFLGVLGAAIAAAVGGSIMAGVGNVQDEGKTAHGDKAAMTACVDACLKCLKECESCFAHCSHHVGMGHKSHEPSMKHCIDCADFCAMCARLCGRDGLLAGHAAHGCKEACEACAKVCEKGDERMKQCAAVCLECAKACAKVASH